jgi:hypothetical protein
MFEKGIRREERESEWKYMGGGTLYLIMEFSHITNV